MTLNLQRKDANIKCITEVDRIYKRGEHAVHKVGAFEYDAKVISGTTKNTNPKTTQ